MVDDDDDLVFASLATLFKSYRDDEKVINKGSVRCSVKSRISPLAGFEPGTSSEVGSASNSFLGSKFFPCEVDLFLERLMCAGKQTGCQTKCSSLVRIGETTTMCCRLLTSITESKNIYSFTAIGDNERLLQTA